MKQLLWMDDEIDDYLPTIERLRREGFDVSEVKTVRDAVEALSKKKFSAIILDQIMNGDSLLWDEGFSHDDMVWGGCVVLSWLLGIKDVIEAPQQVNGLLEKLSGSFDSTNNTNLPIVILSSEISDEVKVALDRISPEANILSLQKPADNIALIKHLNEV